VDYKWERCYASHKSLPLPGGYTIQGGCCGDPLPADVLIGFDSRTMCLTPDSWPWQAKPVTQILFPISDGTAPESADDFHNLVTWVVQALEGGRSVHAGCVGGHGRTGLFLAALAAFMGQGDETVGYVRENYCSKAVESEAQVAFLQGYYNQKKVKPSKRSRPRTSKGPPYYKEDSWPSYWTPTSTGKE